MENNTNNKPTQNVILNRKSFVAFQALLEKKVNDLSAGIAAEKAAIVDQKKSLWKGLLSIAAVSAISIAKSPSLSMVATSAIVSAVCVGVWAKYQKERKDALTSKEQKQEKVRNLQELLGSGSILKNDQQVLIVSKKTLEQALGVGQVSILLNAKVLSTRMPKAKIEDAGSLWSQVKTVGSLVRQAPSAADQLLSDPSVRSFIKETSLNPKVLNQLKPARQRARRW